jgi:hypothetical protein
MIAIRVAPAGMLETCRTPGIKRQMKTATIPRSQPGAYGAGARGRTYRSARPKAGPHGVPSGSSARIPPGCREKRPARRRPMSFPQPIPRTLRTASLLRWEPGAPCFPLSSGELGPCIPPTRSRAPRTRSTRPACLRSRHNWQWQGRAGPPIVSPSHPKSPCVRASWISLLG